MITKSRVNFYKILIAACILFTLYFVSSLNRFDLYTNILSVAGSATATGLFLYCFFKYDRSNQGRIVVLLYTLACGFWFMGDIFWLQIYLMGGDPASSDLCTMLYFGTNIFIFAASMIFMLQQFKKWSLLQLVLDIAVSFCLSFLFVWIVFLHRTDDWMLFLTKDGLVSAVSIALDFLLLVGVFIWFFSRRALRKPSIFNAGAIGLAGFALVDLYYYTIYYKDIYIPNTITDTLYIAVLLGLAMSVLCNVSAHRINDERETQARGGTGIRWYFLIIFPVISFLIAGFNLNSLLFFVLVIVLYSTGSRQVDLSIRSQEVLRREKEMNTQLEKRLDDQLKELTILANQDTVTSLYNRRYFLNALEQTLEELQQCETAALILIDLDRFKNINDNFGHDVGDGVLIEISRRLVKWDDYGSVIARLGGDEFAILVFSSTNKREDLEDACRRIVEACSKPIYLEGRTLYVTLSIGVAIYPTDALDGISLLKNADISMYRAKDKGYNEIVFYDSFFKESLYKKHEIEVLLRQADMDRDFMLYFQPQFSIPDRKLLGAEALLRWNTPEAGFIPPGEFIPVAEEIDLIQKIGKWIKVQAIRQIAAWNVEYGLNLKMGINLSPKELMRDDFPNTFKSVLAKNRANPDWIDIEVTENVMLDPDKVMHIFELFNSMGISISIDDFGSGYSSWGYLTRFPFDRIKIDRTLVENLSYSNASQIQVVKAIITMAKAVGKKTIAEGVEKYEQLDILTSLRCDQVQGYLLGRPVPADVFVERFIRREQAQTMFPQETRRG